MPGSCLHIDANPCQIASSSLADGYPDHVCSVEGCHLEGLDGTFLGEISIVMQRSLAGS